MLSYYKSHSPNYTRIHAFVFICAHTLACRLEESEIDPLHHTGTWNHVSIIYGIASTTFSSAHSALFSVSCFFSTFLLYPSLFSSYQPLSQSPGLELFLNMSEWIEGQRVCKRTHRHTHTAQHNDALAFQECLWANWKQPCVRDEWMKRGRIPYESIRSW